MSKRVMDDIFWLGRYTERTDYHTRLINANLLEFQEISGFEEDRLPLWQNLLEALGESVNYQITYPKFDEKNVLHFLTFDLNHNNSIANCLYLARSNARAVRERLPAYLWETINATHLALKDENSVQKFNDSPYLFYQHIKDRIALFYGISESSMLRLHEWHILQCGRHIERAENTIRILQMMIKNCCWQQTTKDSQNYQGLITTLKVVDSLEGFRRLYAAEITTNNVCWFLLLKPEFPRSVVFALTELEHNLKTMQNLDSKTQLQTNRVQHLLKHLQAILLGIDEKTCSQEDLSNLLSDCLVLCNQISQAFADTVFNLEDVII
ncbi:MAG: alpha-E domain-containing protein [Acidaminococcaceae bacterium]